AALNISDNEYAFGPEGFTDFFVGINCKSGVTYSIVNRPDFVGDDIRELADGSGLVFSVDPNTDAAERRGYITLVSQNGNEQATYVIGIVQAGISGPNITALGNMMELPASEVDLENYKIGISGVDGQTDVFIADNAEWLATGYDEEGNFVYFDAKENLTDQPRTAVATIVAFKNNQTQLIRIPVTQAAHSSVYTFTASPAPIFYDANGGDRDITIQLTGITYLKVDDATVPEWLDYDVSGTDPNFEDGTYNVHRCLSTGECSHQIRQERSR
ncbi:MAG: BACON domain-containing carbohydrate-binding protein, partial [Bacteroidales bacterium]